MKKSCKPRLAIAKQLFWGAKGTIIVAAFLLFTDGVIFATFLISSLACPVLFFVTIINLLFKRTRWDLTVAKTFIIAMTLGLTWTNNSIQLSVAEANAQRIIMACENYQKANSEYPKKISDLVPRYLDRIPPAKYCLGFPHSFFYTSSDSGPTILMWQIVPPFYRKIYDFNQHKFNHLD